MPQLLKKILRNTTLVFVLLIVAFLALPSVVAVFSGGYSYESYHEEELPDNKGSIVLSKRLAFPVNELIDPSIVVKLQLFDESGDELDASYCELLEDSDISETTPCFEIAEDHVTITRISSRKKFKIDLNY